MNKSGIWEKIDWEMEFAERKWDFYLPPPFQDPLEKTVRSVVAETFPAGDVALKRLHCDSDCSLLRKNR